MFTSKRFSGFLEIYLAKLLKVQNHENDFRIISLNQSTYPELLKIYFKIPNIWEIIIPLLLNLLELE